MKILFITPYSSEGASNRYRVEQYLPYLGQHGIDYRVSPFVSAEFYRILYKKGNFFKKILFFIIGACRRIFDLLSARQYDIVFIHREACPFGPPIFEWLFWKMGKKIIFDFDDAIFLPNYHPENRFYRFLKYPAKTGRIASMASCVIVANKFLEEYVRTHNKNVYILPTPIDSERFNISSRKNSPLVIGWVGSYTTTPYLDIIRKALEDLARRYNFVVRIVGGDAPVSMPGVKVENLKWKLQDEVKYFQDLDIGLYPLIDSLWARGKAAFKAIQYMSTGVPVVASPVGMTKEIIEDGVNGYLASTEEEWIEKISELIEKENLRKAMAISGRKTVEEKYSLKVNAPKFIDIIKNI